MGHFGDFWGPNFPKYDSILMKLTPEVVFKERNRLFEKVLEKLTFNANCTLPKFEFCFSFCPILDPIYPLKEAKIEKSK